MSLLLDALKKAAEDKAKVSAEEDTGVENTVLEKKTPTDELSLEEIERAVVEISDNEIVSQDSVTDEGVDLHVHGEEELILEDEVTVDVDKQSYTGISEARPTVSDDALSLLIYKTNLEEKRRKRIFAFASVATSLLVLVIGGVYYYFNLQSEINTLELRHQSSMAMMESKTNKQKTPQKTEIISNLTANNDIKIEKKITIVEVEEEMIEPLNKNSNLSVKKPQRSIKKTPALSIAKSKKTDVVAEKLDVAWLAYENGNYEKAKEVYQEVISQEESNRDAYLGLGAIAVLENDTVKAKSFYKKLLEQDPNDPLAVAALTNLHSEDASPKLSEKYLVAMLEKNPNTAQLNFELGNIYAKQSRWSAAQQSYFKAWKQESENADYIFNLAVSLDQLGQQQQALNFYKDSLLKAKNKNVSFSRATVEKRVNELSGL